MEDQDVQEIRHFVTGNDVLVSSTCGSVQMPAHWLCMKRMFMNSCQSHLHHRCKHRSLQHQLHHSRLIDILQERDGWADCAFLDLQKAFDKMPAQARQVSESVTITPIVRPHPSASPQISPPGGGASGHEKITMKIKKSQVSPNEMVVVGSPRDAKEQQELRKSPEKQPVPRPPFIAPKPQERINTFKVQPKSLQDRNLVRMPEKGTAAVVKPIEKYVPFRMGQVPVRIGERPIAPKVPIHRMPEKSITAVRLPFAKGVVVSRANLPRIPNVVSSTVNTMVPSQGTVTRSSTGTITSKKEMKKKRSKHSEPMLDATQMPTFDTELGLSEKQHLAHGILLRLLRVTSQLPMTEFSHALETLETLTDAFTLRQRVSVNIDHGDNEESEGYYDYRHEGDVDDDDEDEEDEEDEDDDDDDIEDGDEDDDIIEIPVENGYHSENGNGVSSTTDENGLAITQVDGTYDLEVSQGKNEHWEKSVGSGSEEEKNELCGNVNKDSGNISVEVLEPQLKRLKAV
ncbi:uncharacterized protein LOC143035181 isoform X6 [Oratosquilla oratoria]|uniref:uncharacterized protein LOC143035181 isoform X6 n=2 Tax=Oratosquilla oratoria TaxID=337810 RepID=UPI003F7673E8